MELVTGATSTLLPKLGALLHNEYKLQHKVRKEIESLQNELLFMNATLRMVAEVPRNQLDEHVRIWAAIIKDVSYDMEDVVNTFVARVHGAPHLDGLTTKFFNMFCLRGTHHQIDYMVEEIRSLIKEVSDLRDRYRFDNIVTRAATPVVLLQRENTMTRYLAPDCEQITRQRLIKYEEPVIVEEHVKALHNWITSSNNHATLFILGQPGVGKTTIAMALYQNYGDRFQCRAMVKASNIDIDSVELILLDILNQVTQVELRELQVQDDDNNVLSHIQDEVSHMQDEIQGCLQGKRGSKVFMKTQQHQGRSKTGPALLVQDELQECLQGKRFLILLDDVCSTSILELIRISLPNSEGGSKIIVTTRSDVVAGAYNMNKGDHVHKVHLLGDPNAEQLFLGVVGRENQKVIPSSLWKMCCGLPLAIVIMAGLFACNPDKSDKEWGEVCTALAPRPSTSNTEYQLTEILSTCYSDMPIEIKTCALYFSIFPRGNKISRKRLTRRWISEGFVIEQQGLSAEEVAETYLNHLIRRKFLRAAEHSSNGKVKSYQVHDVVLEYIVSKASEENFVTVIGDWIMPPLSTKIRRLSLKFGSSYGKVIKIMNLSHVRDLTMFGSLNQMYSPSNLGGVVQLLDLEGCKDVKEHHIQEICCMLLLKYLSLRRTDIKKLTKRIGDLRFLETLDIRETGVIKLPNAICKLDQLVNIFGGNKRTRMALKLPEDMGRKKAMKALRILSGIEISEETSRVADLHHLTELTKLAIYKLNISKEGSLFKQLSSSIKHLDGNYHLRTLVIHEESSEFFKSLDELPLRPKFLNALELSGKFVELPKCIAEMDALTQLTLSVTALRADNLELLSKIHSLFSLTFSLNAAKQDQETAAIIDNNKAFSDGVILFPVGGFENLKLLRFFTTCVPQLSFPDGALPTVEKLELRFSNFEGHVGIRGLKNLQQVHIKVHEEASENTESIVKEMATAAREDPEGPRIILD